MAARPYSAPPGERSAPPTCPNRACRRTDEHDAKGCVVGWATLVPGAVDGTVVDVGTPVVGPLTVAADTAYFMPQRFKL